MLRFTYVGEFPPLNKGKLKYTNNLFLQTNLDLKTF